MRAVRSVRLLVVIAVLGSAMAFGASSASAFSLSSSTSTKQAGAPTDLNFTYVATGTQSVGRLDVDLPPGVMHDPSSTPACPVADFQTDRCQTPRLGHTVTRINVAGAEVNVPGDIFHIADPADNSDFPLGIVLRPPLSALGLTGKIYLRDRVSFTNGGGLRHSITGPLANVSVLGIPLRSRIARMSLTFTGRSSTANQLYNSTSCASTQLRAIATFSDGRTEDRTSPYSTIGCDRLIFTGGFEFRGAPTATPKKSFAAKLGGVARAPAGVTHEYHRVGGKLDVTAFGEWDDSALADRPVCTDAEFITNTCPIRSQIGTVSVGIEGFPGTRTGAIFHSHPRGAKPKGRIQLRPGVIATFTVDFVTTADGRSLFEVDGLPQLPLTDIDIDIDAPVFSPKGKPASCSNREARGVILGHNGGQTNTTAKYPPEACPPSVAFVDPADEDADGDGFADESLQPEAFDVQYDVADGGNGIDEASATCTLESPEGARAAIRGKVKVVRDTGNGYTGCVVSEAAGDVTVVFSVASIDGHVTVLKSSYNIDSEAPVLSSIAPEPLEPSSTSFVLPFEFTDDRIAHPQSEYEIECVIEDESGARHTTSPGHKYIDTLTLRGGGECMWDTGKSGRFRLEIVVRDSGGHVTVLKRTAVVDAQGPTISLTDPRDQDSDGDGLPDDAIRLSSFDIPFSVGGDDDIDNSSISCKLINPIAMDKGLRVADLDDDGIGDACEVADAPGGLNTVEISAADYRGHVTVLKMAYTVDTDPPVIETSAPDKVVYDLPTIDYEFEFTDDTATHPQSKFKAGVELAGVRSSARVITDRDTGRSKGFARLENVPDGDHELTISVEDSTGHVTVLKVAITVDTSSPVVSLSDPIDADENGDGVADRPVREPTFVVAFSATDGPASSGLEAKCTFRGWDPKKAQYNPGTVKRGSIDGSCAITEAPEGPFELEIEVIDGAGHVTVLKIGFVVDSTGPVLSWGDPEPDDSDADGVPDETRYVRTFDRAVVVVDSAGSAIGSIRCSVSGWDSSTTQQVAAVDLDGDGVADVCRITNAPDGLFVLEFSAEDLNGHVTVLKLAITVEATPPTVTILAPSSGQTFAPGSTMQVRFIATSEGPVSFRCLIDSSVVDAACTPTDSFSLSGLSSGAHTFSVSVEDSRGRSSTSSVPFNISSPPPPDYCIAIYPPPVGCPGYVPPGTTICVTVPYPVCYPAGTTPPGGGISLP